MRPTLLARLCLACLLAAVACWDGQEAHAAGGLAVGTAVEPARPSAELAARLFGAGPTYSLTREDDGAGSWRVGSESGLAGHIASTWEVARSLGYSGQPIDILVGVTPAGRVAGAELMRHNEPILTLGISTEDIAAYVDAFAGYDLTRAAVAAVGARADLPDVIARATVSTGVIRDAILRTARTVAAEHGALGGASIQRAGFIPETWHSLAESGALATARVTLEQARAGLAGAKVPVPGGEGLFLELWVAVIDPPTVGQNLLGPRRFTRATAALAPGDAALLVASRGLHSHRGTAWRRSGSFDRIAVLQHGERYTPTEDDFVRIDRLALPGAPEFREISLFRLPAQSVDASRRFQVEVRAERPTPDGATVSLRASVPYQLPARFLRAAPSLPEEAPLWVAAWDNKRLTVIAVAAMLIVLAAILFLQEALVRRPALWRWGRLGFLTVTLVWLGWIAGGQLSVVQVVAFLHSLLSGFRWETFLIEPVIFLLWGFVALGLLFWGRGVYCGWLCPFGALQELTNEAAQRLGIPQITVPFALHERLWAIKYTLFIAILALSFYSMEQALLLAEVEPFKTAMSLHFLRAWPFVLFVVVLLAAGLFIERFYCRYLCPLGAALAIPAKLKLFDWLHRRPQCGRECRLCEQTCTVGAIDPIGRINPNECVLCLRCQTILNDPATCPVLKRRTERAQARGKRAA